MKLSSRIFFLGWWLAVQLWMARGQLSFKPSISVSPSVVVALGGDVNIHCKSEHQPQAKFYLVKYGASDIPTSKTAQAYDVVFPITNAQQSDTGTYYCVYCSAYSEGVDISVIEPFYPKPFVSVNPTEVVALGESVNIQCNTSYRMVEFSLIKEEALHLQQVKATQSNEVLFPIANTNQEDGGIYRCLYMMRASHDQRYSCFSERVYINITDPSLPTPSIKMTSREQISPGVNVSIECEGQENGVTFSLHKSRELVASQRMEPNRSSASFPSFIAKLEDTGNYTCQYHLKENPFIWSKPSDPVELIVREEQTTEGSTIIIWASIAAGLLLLLLLLAFIFYRKRKRGSTANERNQPVNMPLEPNVGEDPDDVSYAVLNHSLKTKQAAVPDTILESCIYAAVAKDRTRKGQ